MENKITGKNPSPDRDDMELKKHLDEAFERENLTVSEDLIQRTLLRMKEMEMSDPDNNTNDKNNVNTIRENRKKYPVRRFAGAAAAILLLITAVWIYQNSMTGGKMDGGTPENGNTKFSAKVNQQNAAGTEAARVQESADTTVKQQAGKEIASTQDAVNDEGQAAGTEESGNADYGLMGEAADSKLSLMAAPQTLSELYTINNEEIQSFTLQGQAGKKEDLSIDSAVKLYDILKNYTVQASGANTSGDYLYCFAVTDKDKKAITFKFYQDGTADVTDERTENGTIAYVIDKGTDLLNELKTLIKE